MEEIHEISERLSKIDSGPWVRHGDENTGRTLSNHVSRLIVSMEQEVRSIEEGEKPLEQFTRHNFLFEGLPLSGKSWSRQLVTRYIDLWLDNIVNPNLGSRFQGRKISYSVETWEGAEDEARRKGKITTQAALPYGEDELLESDRRFARRLKKANRHSELVIVEAPIIPGNLITEVNGNGQTSKRWIGRHLGGKALYELCHNEGVFKGEEEKKIFATGLVAGGFVRWLGLGYRGAIKSSRTLVQGQAVAEIFHKKIPQNIHQWEAMRREGASQAQIIKIKESFNESARILWCQDRLSTGLGNSEYILDISQDLLEKMMLEDVNSVTLGIPSQNVFIGYNNPNYDDCGFSDWQSRSMVESLIADIH